MQNLVINSLIYEIDILFYEEVTSVVDRARHILTSISTAHSQHLGTIALISGRDGMYCEEWMFNECRQSTVARWWMQSDDWSQVIIPFHGHNMWDFWIWGFPHCGYHSYWWGPFSFARRKRSSKNRVNKALEEAAPPYIALILRLNIISSAQPEVQLRPLCCIEIRFQVAHNMVVPEPPSEKQEILREKR